MRDVEYKSQGVPLEDYELTRRDHSWQRTIEDIRRHAHAEVERHHAELRADPERLQRHREHVEHVWKVFESFETPDYMIMRWRVRLYCGHIVETRRHSENDIPTKHGSSSMRCPECEKDPSAIVAYEPIGLVAPPPTLPAAVPRRPRTPTRTELEQRIASLEDENRRLREAHHGT
ncbi:hypothetical protein ABIA33_001345 [Streptacidiphilus sp. MAP12-16]|uniref:hypothetical protein n=1 Tax=Streptacidiphilus sp. MAP12-16 TaxID=3156300 RepID=UPI00351202D2